MSRGRGFSVAEIDCLLEIIEDVLPIGPDDWDIVTERHVSFYPGLGRSRDSLRRKFSSLYNHKKPTGDPTCPAYVRNAKRIFERIKEVMDVSDGEGAWNGAVGAMGAETTLREDDADDAGIAGIAGPGEVVGGEDGEDGGLSTSNDGGVVNRVADRVSGSVTGFSTSVATPLVGTRIRSPRFPRNAGTASQSSNFSELMQFMMMRADADNRAEQQCQQEREALEDRRRREREEAEERHRREREEAEERRERRMERQLQSQSDMMQMFMLSMMEGRMKRKRDENHDGASDDSKHD
jgi:hypothetical protein